MRISVGLTMSWGVAVAMSPGVGSAASAEGERVDSEAQFCSYPVNSGRLWKVYGARARHQEDYEILTDTVSAAAIVREHNKPQRIMLKRT